jgi:hypothetical protein
MDRGMFPKHVPIPDQRSRPLGLGVKVKGLGRDAERREGPDIVVFTDDHRPLHEAMGSQSGTSADPDRPLEDAVGADLYVFGEFDA